uniref:Uncharacterized protein n=1 Tax=Pseudo-nitzschia arenysensis TaxID=697910 RepID=A0A7R9ZU67_9STRA|mmetsp:Transcript_804/g.1903  ORF Transcript_804/g.1903 Transcript_804/m.1903 type:complete len:423 (+) Transcript_804:2-1270(+)
MNSEYFSASMMAERNWMDMPMRRNTMKSMNEFSPVMEVDSNKTQGKSTTMSIDDDCLDNSIKSLDAPEVFEDANTRRKIYTQPSQHSLLSEISGSTCVGLSQPNTQSANDSFTININMDSKIDGGTKNMRENEMIKNRWTEPTFDLPLKKPMNRSVYMNATKTKCIDDTDSINTTSSVSKKRHIEFEDGNIYPSLEYDSTTVRRSPVYDRTFNLMPGSSGERYKNPTDWSVGGRHNMADTFSTMNMNEESSSGRTSRSNYSTRSYYSNPNSGNYSGNSRNKKEWNSGQEDVVDYSIGGNCQGAPTNQQDDLGHAKLKWSPATGRVAIKLVKNGAVHLNKPFNLEQIKSGQEKGHILVLDDEIEVKIFDDEGHLFCISDLRDIQIGCIIEMKGTRYKVSENTTPGRINSTVVVVVPKKKIRCL